MTSSAMHSLEVELDDRIPDGLKVLEEEELNDLADRLNDAKLRQSQALDAAIGEALEIVPRLLRGPMRKVLFG
jgi:hypothetical protein